MGYVAKRCLYLLQQLLTPPHYTFQPLGRLLVFRLQDSQTLKLGKQSYTHLFSNSGCLENQDTYLQFGRVFLAWQRLDERVDVFGAPRDEVGEEVDVVVRRLLLWGLRSAAVESGKLARRRVLLQDSYAVTEVLRLLQI